MAGITVVKIVLVALCCLDTTTAWPFTTRQSLTLETIQKQAYDNAIKVLDGTLSDGLTNRVSTCNKNTLAVRKEL
jgi:tyrosinase